MKKKIALIGYGVIGKRVADAIAVQDDMELIGVCDVISDLQDMPKVEGDELYYAYVVDSQAIVIPESIDAILALTGIEESAVNSIKRTNKSLGINQK